MKRKERKELTEEEVQIYSDSIISSIKRDFLTSNVSYQDANLMKHVAGYRRESENTPADVRTAIKDKVNGSIVSVGEGKVAIVKRPK